MKPCIGKILCNCLILAVVVVWGGANAYADAILKLQNTNGSPYVDLSQILNGSYDIANILNGSPSAGSINVTNDVVGGISTLNLYYDGVTGTASGDTLHCQDFNFGSGNTTCSVYDPNNNTYYWNGATTPNNLPSGSYEFTFYFPTLMTGNFNIAWSSFSSTADTGCLIGSPSCSGTSVPESSTLLLLGAGVVGLTVTRKRKLLG